MRIRWDGFDDGPLNTHTNALSNLLMQLHRVCTVQLWMAHNIQICSSNKHASAFSCCFAFRLVHWRQKELTCTPRAIFTSRHRCVFALQCLCVDSLVYFKYLTVQTNPLVNIQLHLCEGLLCCQCLTPSFSHWAYLSIIAERHNGIQALITSTLSAVFLYAFSPSHYINTHLLAIPSRPLWVEDRNGGCGWGGEEYEWVYEGGWGLLEGSED